MKECNSSKRQNETTEQREARLAKERERKRASRKRAQGEKKDNYSSHPVEEGASNPVVSNHFLNENIDELALVRKFHNSVSAGPLYICTCCDQLWYKHSVSLADRLRLVNPEITKYLQNIKSVDDIKWIFQTCNNHLKKGRVPPCAIANGMQFPEKPSFFDLKELECRLIAPRLAFQKIFQAPRGGQLKITGNIVNVPADVNSTVSDNEKQEIYNFAPGEGNKPLSVFRDQFSKEMAYPGIFLGQKRPDDKERLRNVHYSEICKSELRRSDRRAAMCVENIFFKAKKLQMKFLIGQSQIAL